MKEFSYKAKKGPGAVVEGVVRAMTQVEALGEIERMGLVPLEVAEAVVSAGPKKGARGGKPARQGKSVPARPRSGKIPFRTICVFTRQLASMMRSKVQILRALEFIGSQAQDPRLLHILEHVSKDVKNGTPFSDSLSAHGAGSFDHRYISMIRSGESGGSLDRVLQTLAEHLEREDETRSQIRSALAYPMLIVVVGIGTVFFMFTFVLPKLTSLFNQSYETLPMVTKMLMALARPSWQSVFWGVFGGALVGLLAAFGGKAGKARRQWASSRLPLLGEVKTKADIARFCDTLAMLLDQSVPVHQAIEVTRPVLSNDRLEKDLADAQRRISEGETLAEVIKRAQSFGPFVAQMIAVGEEGGDLSGALREVAHFYSAESLRSIKMLSSLIEPLLILALSLLVGLIVSAIMLPIFDMSWMK
ncbi:MAG: type II secretion system F family protein [Candidatus Omnitrophica bacterium]|nr:type II secretion system F family protein [Candidatus Omnitrophota bacterium]